MKYCINFFGSLTNWGTTNCADKLGNKEAIFCDPESNSCKEKPIGDCDPTSKFECTRNGYYPHVNNCQKYLHCHDGKLNVSDCPERFVYNHSFGTCVLKLANTDCVTIGCNHAYGNLIEVLFGLI